MNSPNGLTSINAGTFASCYALKSIVIPNSVTSIGDEAFQGCDDLREITIPASVTYVGKDAFEDTEWQTRQLLSGNIYINNVFYKAKGKQAIIDIKEGTTLISPYAFSEYGYVGSSQVTVTIPTSITTIGDCAFANCVGLKAVEIPNSVTSIGKEAFRYTALTTVDIPSSVTSIGESAFYYCRNLTSVTIPESVKEIGGSAFGACSNLKSVSVAWSEPLDFSDDPYSFLVFLMVDKDDCYLYVPTGTSALYSAADVWKDFTNIVEDDNPLGIGGSVKTEKTVMARYNISGQRIYAPERGINVIKYDDGTTKKVLVK